MLRLGEIVASLRRRWSPIVAPDPTLALHQRRRTLAEREDFERVMSDWLTRRPAVRGAGRRKSRR
jgi:hypothetical protein